MFSTKFLIIFSLINIIDVSLGGSFDVTSCYYCNGNCTGNEKVTCNRPRSGCISYKITQNNKINVFKNCYVTTTWNCEKVIKWVANKNFLMNITDCQTCLENNCNKDTFALTPSSARKSNEFSLLIELILSTLSTIILITLFT